MSLQITNSQRDNDELKYYEDVYTSEDNITIDGKQLPSFTIVENTYYTGESDDAVSYTHLTLPTKRIV